VDKACDNHNAPQQAVPGSFNSGVAAASAPERRRLGIDVPAETEYRNTCMDRTLLLRLLAVLGATWCLPQAAFALDFPTRTVTIIVPFSAGGGTDVQARQIGKALSARLGKPVVIDNRPGAGGQIAATLAAQAAPDGHTLFLGSTGTLVVGFVLRQLDPLRDFAPVMTVTEMPLVLVPSPALPAKDLTALIRLARQKPGELTYASAGAGSFPHLIGEMFKLSAQVDIVHVPYKGSAPALIDVVGGQVSMAFVTPASAISQIRSGKLRAVAVTGTRRLPALPEVPTLSEAGVRGVDTPLWYGFVVPKKTQPEVIAVLYREITAATTSAEFARAAENEGAFVVGRSPLEFTERIRTDMAIVQKLVKATNLKVEE
jgi:tripartite-type tricarboxylate transporter receptor subunit TctC